MNKQLRAEIQNRKTRYILGVEAYSKDNKRLYTFDPQADYSSCFEINDTTIFRFFKVPFYRIIRKHDEINHFLFGFKIKSESAEEIYYKRNLQKIDIDYDDAYVLQGGSGEPFLWIASAARGHFECNNTKKPLVIGTRGSFSGLVKMYLPGVPYIVRGSAGSSFDTESTSIEYSNHRIFLTKSHPKHLAYLSYTERYIPSGHTVFKQFALDGLQLNKLSFPRPIISNEGKESLASKANSINLNLDNFVILAPEANYFYELHAKFWESTAQKFTSLGVDVFLNIINKNHYIDGCKTLHAPLTYEEIYELSCRAKAVISLRSGFTETILPTLTPNIVILTATRDIFSQPQTASNPESTMFGLVSIPFAKKECIRGVYFYDHDTEDDAVNSVISCYEEMTTNPISINEES